MFPRILNSGIQPMVPSPLQQLLLSGGVGATASLPAPPSPPSQPQSSGLETLTMALLLSETLGSGGSSPLSLFENLLGTSSSEKAQTQTAKTKDTGPLVIAQIDQFDTDNTGFNHGEAVADEITNGGDDIELLQFDVAGGNTTAKIAGSLEQIIQKVKNGERIDAVNISQQDFTADADTERVQKAIDELQALGVPVAVAAGNNGPNARNELATDNAFIVESSNKNTSGTGNIQAEGRSTSFATANAVPLLAQLKAQGLSIDEIRQSLS